MKKTTLIFAMMLVLTSITMSAEIGLKLTDVKIFFESPDLLYQVEVKDTTLQIPVASEKRISAMIESPLVFNYCGFYLEVSGEVELVTVSNGNVFATPEFVANKITDKKYYIGINAKPGSMPSEAGTKKLFSLIVKSLVLPDQTIRIYFVVE